MKRREFLKTSLAASAATGLSAAGFKASARPAVGASPEYYEIRAYHCKAGPAREVLEGYLAKSLIPLLNRLGSQPVGVFVQQERSGAPEKDEVRDEGIVFVLIPYPAIEAFASTTLRIEGDEEHHRAGSAYWGAPKSAPAYERMAITLMRAFTGMPKLELPPYCKEKQPRMFEIRQYESHSEQKAMKKIEMFNSGEIEVMHEVGLGPIFYGQTMTGQNLPHLTYMLSAENTEEHKKHWGAFGKHPVWNKMKNDPQYADTVSNITKRFLVPRPYSQI